MVQLSEVFLDWIDKLESTTYMNFSHEIEIDAPIDYAFAWGNTPENWPRVMPNVLEVEEIEQTDEGTRYRTTMKALGRTTITEDLTIIDEENYVTTSTFEDGAMDGEMEWSYTESDTGTIVRCAVDIEADSLFERALQPVFGRVMSRQVRNSLETMKELVEVEYAQDEPKLAQV